METDTEQDVSKATTPMEAAFNMIEQENQELKDKIRELEIRIQEISHESQAYAQKCEQELQCTHAREQWLLKDREDIRLELDEQNRAADKLRKTAEQEAQGLRQKLKAEMENVSDLQEKLTIKTKTAEELRTRLDSEKKAVQDLRTELDNKSKKMVKLAAVVVLLFILACLPSVYLCLQLEEYKSENRSLYQDTVSLRAESALLLENVGILQDASGSLEEENTALKEENTALKVEIVSLEVQKDSLESGNRAIMEEYNSLLGDFQLLQTDYEKIHAEYDFYHMHAVIVYNDGTTVYHRYGCPEGSDKGFWIYNSEQAKGKDYTPCSTCMSSVTEKIIFTQ